MPRKPIKPQTNVFEYSDFRAYLKEVVAELKKRRDDFTMRHIAEMVGFGSPSFLKMIIDGQRNLTQQSLEKLCTLFHIKGKEKQYFSLLVEFCQTDNPDTKHQVTKKMDKIRPRVTFSKLKKNQHKYLSHDYYTCIREMVLLDDFKEDAKWIASKCLPRIKPAEAREAINTLLELKLLKRDGTGKLLQSDPIVDTGQDAQATEAFSFHEAVLNKARRYLSHLDQKNRNFTALTIPIPSELDEEISQRIEVFQSEILQLINRDGLTYDNVFQLNIQFFPVTDKKKIKKDKNEK